MMQSGKKHLSKKERASIEFKKLNSLVEKNAIDDIESILKKYKSLIKKLDLDEVGNILSDAMHCAIVNDKLIILELFLKYGAPVNNWAQVGGPAGHIRHLIDCASDKGDEFAVDLLVRYKADIVYYQLGHEGFPAIQHAILKQHTNVVKYLLEANAEASGVFFDKTGHRRTFLGFAANQRNEMLVELLIQHKASLLGALNHNFDAARDMSSLNSIDYWESVRLLLDHSMGFDFYEYGGLNVLEFLPDNNATGLCFLGISINGNPMTREMLKKRGIRNYDYAIITEQCIERLSLTNPIRSSQLNKRLERAFLANGKLLAGPYVNLVPLNIAIEEKKVKAIKARLNANISPNWSPQLTMMSMLFALEETNIFTSILPLYELVMQYALSKECRLRSRNASKEKEQLPISIAARQGSVKVMKLLVKHSMFNPRLLPIGISEATEHGNTKIVKYLTVLSAKRKNF